MKIAAREDQPQLTALWEACFGDPQAVVQGFWAAMWDTITVFTNEDGTAMATAMPLSWQGKPAAYLYAVATDPAHQGKGLCRRLMAEAEAYLKEQGFSYALLSPAEPSLFRFYEKLGYQTVFFCDRKYFSAAGTSLPVFSVTPEQYGHLRAKFAPENAVSYPLPLLSLQASAGSLVKIADIGCAALERTRSGWIARELLSAEPETASAALCAYLKIPEIEAKTPGKTPYGMAKSLDGSPLLSAYLGFAFE